MDSKSLLELLKTNGIIDFNSLNHESGQKGKLNKEEEEYLIGRNQITINNEFFDFGDFYEMKDGTKKLLLFKVIGESENKYNYYQRLINKVYHALGIDLLGKAGYNPEDDDKQIELWKYQYEEPKNSFLREWNDEESGYFIRIGFNKPEQGLVFTISN